MSPYSMKHSFGKLFGRVALLGFSALALTAGSAHAALTVVRANHFEINYDVQSPTRLGTPLFNGSGLSFAPSNMFAQQIQPGLDFARATVTFNLYADPGYTFSGIRYLGSGDYFGIGSGANVSALGQLRAFDILNPMTRQAIAQYTPSGPMNQFSMASTTNWANTAFIDLRSTAWAGTTSLSVTVENLLLAYNAPQGMLAFIEQKFAGLQVDVAATGSIPAVPEPGEWASLLVGLGMLGIFIRRKRS